MESTILAAFLGVAAMAGCMLWVVRPLWQAATLPSPLKEPGDKAGWLASTVWSDWLDQKETLLFNLEDLAHEQRLGKISQEDFSRLQSSYKRQLVALLDRMDNNRPPENFQNSLLGIDAGGTAASIPVKAKDAVGVCFHCKTFYEQKFKFCPQCGAALTVRS